MKTDGKNSHCVILTDIGNGRIVVLDLDQPEPLAAQNIVWQWAPTAQQGWQYTSQELLVNALSDVRVRWSQYHNTRAVLFTSARGSVGMIAYPGGECLWEAKVGISPHAMELLPNGDIVVAASGGSEAQKGRMHYLQRQEDGSYMQTCEHSLYGAHGVLWDPEQQILWASGFDDVVAFRLETDEEGRHTMSLVEGRGVTIPCSYGHDLMQDLSNPDILWVSPSPEVYQFTKSGNQLLTEFPHSDVIHPLLRAKGIASFPDGVVVWVAYGHHTSSEHPTAFSAMWPKEDGTADVITYTDESAGWNKARVFLDGYTS